MNTALKKRITDLEMQMPKAKTFESYMKEYNSADDISKAFYAQAALCPEILLPLDDKKGIQEAEKQFGYLVKMGVISEKECLQEADSLSNMLDIMCSASFVEAVHKRICNLIEYAGKIEGAAE